MKSVVVNGGEAEVNGRRLLHMCSNDYLGLSHHPLVLLKTREAIKEVSQCSSRLIAGNNPNIEHLEGLLCRHRNTEASLVFPTGYMANLAAVTALAGKDSTILSDQLNHASIIDACRLSGAKVLVYRHNDMAHLKALLGKTSGRPLVITEGVFSMDGDFSNLKEICQLAHSHNALMILDDAHGDFIFGKKYSGVASLMGAKVDVHVSSLSKGLGCFGGYVAASSSVIELLINTARQFIYTSALPDHLCVAASEAIPLAKKGHLQKKLHRNAAQLRKQLVKAGFEIGKTQSQIIPVMIGREDLALQISNSLSARGIFGQAIRYPTVEKGKARIRLSVTADHTLRQIGQAVEAIRLAAMSSS
jgi:glycine C-acetyltransferase